MGCRMMNRDEVQAAVRAFVVGHIARPVADNENYFANGFVKSLFGLQLIAFIERRFGATVADSDLSISNFDSIDHVTDYVCRTMERTDASS
jgi:methoxymalonate biosynthesis acyl carrier protein